MRKFSLLLLILTFPLFADLLRFDNIDTTLLLKKDRSPVNVDISLTLKGRDLNKSEIELMDTVQTALGNFWAETLVTSEGKERLKKMIIDLADKKYGIEVDFVYIGNIKVQICTLERLRELLSNVRR
ncbi:MAG: hypothetical protein L3J42_07810 [Hydrogenimonas sp.]|nr:hypothetical protein [Hydrogenimonas sp.]